MTCRPWSAFAVFFALPVLAGCAVHEAKAPPPVQEEGRFYRAGITAPPAARDPSKANELLWPERFDSTRGANKFLNLARGAQPRLQSRCWQAAAAYPIDRSSDHNHAISLNNRATARANLRDYDGAVADTTAALEHNSSYALAHNTRGAALYGRGELKEAVKDYEVAIRLGHHNAQIRSSFHSNCGQARLYLGELKLGLADLTRAIEIDPRNAEAWNIRGVVRDKLSDHKGAIEDYTEALRLDAEPTLNRAYTFNNRGYAHLELGRLLDAVSDFTEALRIYPDYEKAERHRSRALRLLDEQMRQ